ncbi:MAG: ATP-dependent helicase [Propionibacteriaceae bacterium]|nr:ATP-dependent helicase [Propionibacteriaceae bacterium]
MNTQKLSADETRECLLRVLAEETPDVPATSGVGFSEEQWAAISAPLAPGVIVAGAGTGKTTVMKFRVCYLVLTGQVAPGQVLGLTFTRKAAAELNAKVAQVLRAAGRNSDDDPTVSTYDAFAAELVRRFGMRLGLDPAVRLLEGAKRFQLAGLVLERWAGPLPVPGDWAEVTVIKQLLALDAAMTSHLVTPEAVLAHCEQVLREVAVAPLGRNGNPLKDVMDYGAAAENRAGLVRLVAAYRALKRELGVAEFADQMAAAVRLAETFPEIGRALRAEYHVVLLDEYQDTSVAQTRLLAALFGGAVDVAGRGHPVTAVGDPLQAIYGWRGASSVNIGEFATLFPDTAGHPATLSSLSYNRRSGQAILDVANAVAATVPAAVAATDGLAVAQMVLREPAERKLPVWLGAASYPTRGAELAALVERVLAVRAELGTWSDIAVLTRKNALLGEVYATLTEAGIPAEIIGLGGLLARPDVSAVVATLKLLADPGDNACAVELLSGPRWRLGPRDLALLGSRAKALARKSQESPPHPETEGARLSTLMQPRLLDAIRDPGKASFSAKARERLARFAAELAELTEQLHEPAVDLVHRVVSLGGYFLEALAEQAAGRGDGGVGLRRFLRLVAEFDAGEPSAPVAALLAWLEAEADYGNDLEQATPSQDDSVKLLTVHKAKGLEWGAVLLPDLRVGGFPDDVAKGVDATTNPQVLPPELRGDHAVQPRLGVLTTAGFKAYREALRAEQAYAEDRLSYVAVTRAKRVLSASMSHWRPGVKDVSQPSRLFGQILAGTVAAAGEVSLVDPEMVPEQNPYAVSLISYPWPPKEDTERQEALDWLTQAVVAGVPGGAGDELSAAELTLRKRWQEAADRLIADRLRERASFGRVALPLSLSASEAIRAAGDRAGFALQLLRPIPRPISQASSIGGAFHAWLERLIGGTAGLWDDTPGENEDGEDTQVGPLDAAGDERLRALQRAWLSGEYGERTPLEVELPFVYQVAGQQLRGRIDAVYQVTEGTYRYQIVDWKTGGSADDMQLAIYRAAFAAARGIDVAEVDAVCYFVGEQRVYRPAVLPDEGALAGWIAGLATDATG